MPPRGRRRKQECEEAPAVHSPQVTPALPESSETPPSSMLDSPVPSTHSSLSSLLATPPVAKRRRGRPRKEDAKVDDVQDAKPSLDMTPDKAVDLSEMEAKRVRWAPEEAIRDCIIGFVDDGEEDPGQSGIIAPRQSKEIQALASSGVEVPIAKDRRSGFVWVAAAKPLKKDDSEKDESEKMEEDSAADAGTASSVRPRRGPRYTWNVDDMMPLPAFRRTENNTCDVCGCSCKEVLYEFRCYRRNRPGAARRQAGRRLHSFVSYISKECGRGLLGIQSEASKLRERLFRVVSDGEGAVERLKEIWRVANAAQRRVITEELRHFARTEVGESQRAVEIRKAEASHGVSLYPTAARFADDMFRAAGRALAPVVSARELASGVVMQMRGIGSKGFLGNVKKCLEQRKPLPYPSTPWDKADIVRCCRYLVQVWPIRIELLDSLSTPEHFEPEEEALASLRFIYLPGCGELHAPAEQKVEKAVGFDIKEPATKLLQRCRESFSPMEALIGRRGPVKAEDKLLQVPSDNITPEHVCAALQAITWPSCFSRNNVKPDGSPFIYAFPVGIVLNYSLGLLCSRPTKLYPNLTMILTKFLNEHCPEHKYTTIQLNRDYATKMHVDGNNHGPSYIIGLGDYEGGDLWILDEEEGEHEEKLPCPMRGWPHLETGKPYKGRVVSCKNKWVKFDGNVPHCTKPFTGNRISLVYFTRKGYMTMRPDAKELLEQMYFQLPGEEYLELSTERADDGSKKPAKRVAKSQEGNVEEAIDDDEEVDEDEEVDAVMREELDSSSWRSHNWASIFRKYLGCDHWEEENVDDSQALVVSSAFVGAAAPVYALKELLPGSSRMRIASMSEREPSSGAPSTLAAAQIRFIKRNCQPEHAFSGQLCEVHHRACKVQTETEDLFIGCFSCAPFLNRDGTKRGQSCFDDPNATPFLELRRHLEDRRPRAAVLQATGFEGIEASQRPGVLAFLLDGTEPQSGTPWGLRQLEAYAVDVVDLHLPDYGLPRPETCTHFVLVRKDCGGEDATTAATLLAQGLGSKLPACAVQDLLFEEDDSRLAEVRRSQWKHRLEKSEDTAKSAKEKAAAQKALGAEAKELGLKPGEAPYSDWLRKEMGDRFEEWFPHGTPSQVTQLNLLYTRAQQTGLDLEGLIVDLGQISSRRGAWRDDGFLPCDTTGIASNSGPYYSFARHRLLTGQEVLLCQGFPVWRMNFRGHADAQIARFATGSGAVTAMGASLCAVLAVADFGPKRQAQRAPADRIRELLATEQPKVGPAATAMATLAEGDGVDLENVAPSGEEAQMEGRAAALLNLVSHGAFASEVDTTGEDKEKRKHADEVRTLMSSLSHVAEDASTTAGAAEELQQNPVDEPRDWPTRLTELKTKTPKFGWKVAMRWACEAAEDREADLSADLVAAGLAYLQKILTQNIPDEVMQDRGALVETLSSGGFASEANKFDEWLRSAKFAEKLAANDPKVSLSAQTDKTMQRYVAGLVHGCSRNGWPMRRCFLEHLANHKEARSSKGPNSESPNKKQRIDCLQEFGNHGGWREVTIWLNDMPTDLEVSWPSAAQSLESISRHATHIPSTDPVLRQLLPSLYQAAQRIRKSARKERIVSSLEAAMIEAVAPAMLQKANAAAARETLTDFSSLPGDAGKHFQSAASVSACCLRPMQALLKNENMDSMAVISALKQSFKDEVSSAVTELPVLPQTSPFNKLSKMQTALVEAVERKLDDRVKALEAQAEKERVEKDEAQASQARAEAEAAAKEILELISEGSLRDECLEGLNAILFHITGLHQKLSACGRPPVDASNALARAQAAASRYCQRPARLASARKWLREANLGHCTELLEAHGLLESYRELKAAPVRGQEFGLPQRCREALERAVNTGKLTENKLAPAQPPKSFLLRQSRSVGLVYFQAKGKEQGALPTDHETSKWIWPTEPEPPVVIDEPQELKDANLPVCKGRAAYIHGNGGAMRCLLCGESGREHFATEAHQSAAQQWQHLRSEVRGLCQEIEALPEQKDTEERGLVKAWRVELRLALQRADVLPYIQQVFWHLVVRPHFPSPDSGSGENAVASTVASATVRMKGAAALMLEVADAPEPTVLAKIPTPGIDFLNYPESTIGAFFLNPGVCSESIKALGVDALRGEGIETRDGDTFWCGYCEREVEDLIWHLAPSYQMGKAHARVRDEAVACTKRLRKEGWRLQHEGISITKRTYQCIGCKQEGAWTQVWHHVGTEHHKKARRIAVMPTVPTEEEREAWEAACAPPAPPRAIAITAAPPTENGGSSCVKPAAIANDSDDLEAREAEKAAQNIHALLSGEALRKDSSDGVIEMFAGIRELRSKLAKCQTPPALSQAALTAGQAACRLQCDRPAREGRASQWLRQEGLEHCATILQGQGLLHRMRELGADPQLAASAGLPPRCCQAIIAAVAEGRLREVDLEPGPPPANSGWKFVFSKSVGLNYYQATTEPYQTQWECPESLAEVHQIDVIHIGD